MKKILISNKFRIRVVRIGESLSSSWYEDYTYDSLSDKSNKEVRKYFRQVISDFNADLGSKPRRLIAVQRQYLIQNSKSSGYKYLNI